VTTKDHSLATVPITSYLTEHPRARVVFDSGMHVNTQHNPAGHADLLATLHQFDYGTGEDIATRLTGIDIDPASISELCAPVRLLVRQDSVVIELTARHRITSFEWDATERAVAMVVEITDPQTARPVDVRIDVLEAGTVPVDPRAKVIGPIVRNGRTFDVLGTYLGVVADEIE
jgi:hypothetical protein